MTLKGRIVHGIEVLTTLSFTWELLLALAYFVSHEVRHGSTLLAASYSTYRGDALDEERRADRLLRLARDALLAGR